MLSKLEEADVDPQETKEWLDALEAVLREEGPARAHYLVERLIDKARRSGAYLACSANTAYVNTIHAENEPPYPGDPALENRLRAYIRWNALAMVVRANKETSELGGHIASFASSATLYDVGFNHFWRAHTPERRGDLVLIQGHSTPGIYARAFLEGRIDEARLDCFRREVGCRGLSSYPHPWLMPDFWQFPTVSMGLGPLMAIYQARFMKYLHDRDILDTSGRRVWCFIGDGEVDEPETLGSISLAARERLDNLIFVVNCNLQRLDGPVRGNGKIIQELEAIFRGANWNVVKVLWGSYWDPLLALDHKGLLHQRMMEAVDGDYQNYKSKDGAYVRKHFFGKSPELLAMVAKLSDEDIWRLNRGGHDPFKVHAAYHEAMKHKGGPTVILAHTVKGYGMGASGEAQNRTHSAKKMEDADLLAFRDRFGIPLNDEEVKQAKYVRPPDDAEEMKYLKERREALGGSMPVRISDAPPLEIPDISVFSLLLKSSGDRELSTTMALVRMISALARDEKVGRFVVPIVPDEGRTFGMEGLFRQLGIYSREGQLYEPQDRDQLTYYREEKKGQFLEEGINEAGSQASWMAAATSYSVHGVAMIPFYVFYSMFGFQRVGDLIWAGADMQARGFLIGATSGRTTLAGEGLQHQDGHSHTLAANVPNCISYDPTYAYELAVIIHAGMRRMYEKQDKVFYYVTTMNENYRQPEMPEGAEEGIVRGLYLLREAKGEGPRVQLMGSGAILREALAAADILASDHGVAADVWSATSFNELAREGRDWSRHRMLHPGEEAPAPWVTSCLASREGPVIAATDYVKAYPDQIRAFVPRRYTVLGTDGFGRSDLRKTLRHHFEIDRGYIVLAALEALASEGLVPLEAAKEAISRYEIDPDKPNPRLV